MKLLKVILINYYKAISVLMIYNHFYNKWVNFKRWEKLLRHISKNILGINKTSKQVIVIISKISRKKFKIQNKKKIIISFIIKLLRSQNLIIIKQYNIIEVMVNRLVKYFYIILFNEKYMAK